MTRFLGGLATLLLLVSCQNESHAVFSPIPSPSPPHTAVTAAILQPGDVPAGLTVCPGSGPIDVYIETLAVTNQALATKVADQWDALLAAGARSGAVSIYGSATSTCAADLGATGSAKSVASLVAVFADSGQADRAWQTGVFGFAPPPPGEVAPGVVRGTATDLGVSSFTFVHLPVRLASWHRSVFVALVVVNNLDQAAFSAAAAAVDARLN